MAYRGAFNPGTQSRPSTSGYPAAQNRIANSSSELGELSTTHFASAGLTATVSRSNTRAFGGQWSTRVQLAGTSSTRAFWLKVPATGSGTVAGCWVYTAQTGRQIAIGTGTGSGQPVGGAGYALTAGVWNWVGAEVGPASEEWLGLGNFATNTMPTDFYVDGLFLHSQSFNWQPAAGEPFYTVGDWWVIQGAGTFAGVEYRPGDVVTVVSMTEFSMWPWAYIDDVVWERTEWTPDPDGPIAQLFKQRPTAAAGAPIYEVEP